MTRRSCYRRRLGPVVFLLYYCSFVLFVPSVLVPAFKRHHSVIPHFVLQSLGFLFAVGFGSSLPTHMSHTSSYSTVYGFLLSRTFFFFYPRLTLCTHRLFAFSFWYTQHRLPCISLHTFFLTFHHNIKLYQGADLIAKLYFNFPKSSDLKAKVSVFCLFQIRISHKNLTIKVCFKIQIEGENEDTKYGNSLFSVFFFYFLTPTFPPVVIFVWRCCSYHYSP